MAVAEGQGLAFEAAKAARKYACEEMGWSTAISIVNPSNLRSISLAKRLGAKLEKSAKHPTIGDSQVWRHKLNEVLD